MALLSSISLLIYEFAFFLGQNSTTYTFDLSVTEAPSAADTLILSPPFNIHTNVIVRIEINVHSSLSGQLEIFKASVLGEIFNIKLHSVSIDHSVEIVEFCIPAGHYRFAMVVDIMLNDSSIRDHMELIKIHRIEHQSEPCSKKNISNTGIHLK